MDIHAKLNELGLKLPPAPKPVAAYVPSVQAGELVYISGQIPIADGQITCTGQVPSSASLETAQDAARLCCLNALAILDDAIGGNWSRLVRIVRIGVFVASSDDFTDQPKVANGASELLVEIFGETGRHTRAAVGLNVLPLNSTVELEMIAQIAPQEA